MTALEVWDRSGFVGCSDLPPILGFPKFGRDRWMVWAEKAGVIEPEPGSTLTRWGQLLEDVVARQFTEERGIRLRRQNARATHPRMEFFSAQIDRRVVGKRELCEIKTVDASQARLWGASGTDEIPEHVMPQVQGQLGLTGCELAHVVALVGGNDLRHYFVEPNRDWWELIEEEVAEFWRQVQEREEPTPELEASVNRRWLHRVSGEPVVATPEQVELVRAWLRLKAGEKTVKAKREAIELEIKDRVLRDAELLEDAEGRPLLTWKQQSKFDAAVAAERFPEQVAECSTALDPQLLKKRHPDAYQGARVPSHRSLLAGKGGRALLRQQRTEEA